MFVLFPLVAAVLLWYLNWQRGRRWRGVRVRRDWVGVLVPV